MLQTLGILLQGLAGDAAAAPAQRLEATGPAPDVNLYTRNLRYVRERLLPEGWRLSAVQVSRRSLTRAGRTCDLRLLVAIRLSKEYYFVSCYGFDAAQKWDAHGHGISELAPAAVAAGAYISVLYNWEARLAAAARPEVGQA